MTNGSNPVASFLSLSFSLGAPDDNSRDTYHKVPKK